MYEVYVQAPDFKGKRTVMQHRMVNEVSSKSNIQPQYRGLAAMRPACHLDTQNTVF